MKQDSTTEIVFTSAAILDLLLQIEELQGYDVGLTETDSGLRIQIGDSVYLVDDNSSTDIPVEKAVVDQISDAAETAYEGIADNLSEQDIAYDTQPVEGGLLTELTKSLLLGGLIRFTKKHLLN